MRSLADRFNVKLLCTAAESPWSNGVCERLNGILGQSVQRIMDDTSCSVQVALSWAVAARNSLHNFSGYSPSQLVFGKNPCFPNVLEAIPPALEERSSSDIVCANLSAMNSARKDFIQTEADDRVRRALLRQIRDDDPRKFEIGNSVYYKRADSDQWHGPANVIGRDGKLVIVRHGGAVVRVHACRLQHQCVDAAVHGEVSAPLQPEQASVDEIPSREIIRQQEDDDHEPPLIQSYKVLLMNDRVHLRQWNMKKSLLKFLQLKRSLLTC